MQEKLRDIWKKTKTHRKTKHGTQYEIWKVRHKVKQNAEKTMSNMENVQSRSTYRNTTINMENQ